MARKHHKPEEIVAKLRQVEVSQVQGKTAVKAVRSERCSMDGKILRLLFLRIRAKHTSAEAIPSCVTLTVPRQGSGS